MPITAMARLTRHQREQAILRLHAGQSVELLANVYNVHISRLPSCTQKQRYQQHQRPPGTGWLRVTARHWLASCHRPALVGFVSPPLTRPLCCGCTLAIPTHQGHGDSSCTHGNHIDPSCRHGPASPPISHVDKPILTIRHRHDDSCK